MNISKNYRELVGIFLQTEDGSFNFFAKTHSKAGMPGFVPILSVQEFSTRRWCNDHLHRYGRRRSSSARICSHGMAWARS
jgi:hypothetical protein